MSNETTNESTGSSNRSQLQPGDFVHLSVSWIGNPDRSSPFGDRIGTVLGSGTYPTIERDLINADLDTETIYLVADADDDDDSHQITKPPTLNDLFDQRTNQLLEQLGFTSLVSFLTADLSGVGSLPVDQDRLREMQRSVKDSLDLERRDLLRVSLDEAYRWSDPPAGLADPDVVNRLGSEPSEWPTSGGDVARTGSHTTDIAVDVTGSVRWTAGPPNFEVSDVAPSALHDTVFVWTDRGIAALSVDSGEQTWEVTDAEIVGEDPTESAHPIVGAEGMIYVGPHCSALDVATGEREWVYFPDAWKRVGYVSLTDERICIIDGSGTSKVKRVDNSEDTVRLARVSGGPYGDTAYDSIHDAVITGGRGNMYSHSIEDGRRNWRTNSVGGELGTPAVGTLLYATSDDRVLFAVEQGSGEVLWETEITDTPISDPVSTDDGVYAVSQTGLHEFEQDSGEALTVYTFDEEYSDMDSPIRPGIVKEQGYERGFVAAGERVHAIDLGSGDCELTVEFEATVTTQPTYIDGTVLVRTADGRLHAIE
ncbi:PQQ-binding-like beta-propeller repeat protein [Halobaculum sp. WSA2]|uniref:PQQ-binding-like beta-propeller repeat protein n=1 Tax=Halobaculum saliterrae TaxID=2073113 RepID=A0A6B0SP85_9EURY|nr:PQQ-binding-like beta-propeller repeat protein [Halobaculum saliterrae]MXR40714.1 PQQ-binding-like beta-propeller repeat protein [Halobaculum saliterrae]